MRTHFVRIAKHLLRNLMKPNCSQGFESVDGVGVVIRFISLWVGNTREIYGRTAFTGRTWIPQEAVHQGKLVADIIPIGRRAAALAPSPYMVLATCVRYRPPGPFRISPFAAAGFANYLPCNVRTVLDKNNWKLSRFARIWVRLQHHPFI
jgi:hypothetical protein